VENAVESSMRLLPLILGFVLSAPSWASPSTSGHCNAPDLKAWNPQNLVGTLTQWPTPRFLILEQDSGPRFVAPSKVYSSILGTHERSLILNSIEELRFLSQALAHSEVLLVLKDHANLDEARATALSRLSHILDIKLSLLWLDDRPSPKVLKDLVRQSGGQSFTTKDLLRRIVDFCPDGVASR
jgi:hypothetical protein